MFSLSSYMLAHEGLYKTVHFSSAEALSGGVGVENKAGGNADKITFPYSLQPTEQPFRQAAQNLPRGSSPLS